MKKALAFTISLILIFMSGCQNTNKDDDTFKIVTSFYPIYIMVMNITDGVEGVEISCMADNNTGCLHDFQLQTKDMKAVEKADAFIINGAGMETFINKITNELPNLTIIDSSVGIDLIHLDEGHEHNHDEHSEEHSEDEEYNGHIWISVKNYKIQVQNITDELIKLDPEHKEQYQANAQAYLNKLTNLENEMHSTLDSIQNKNIITFHEAFNYFAEEFNFNIVSVIAREPGSEPSASELAETINLIKETNTNVIFVEPQYPRTAADTVADETDAKVYILDPCVTGDIDKDAYINAMENNLKVLSEALN